MYPDARFQQRLSVRQSIGTYGPPRQGSHLNKTQPEQHQQRQWLHTEPDLEPTNQVVVHTQP
jgi:hypothetical protein